MNSTEKIAIDLALALLIVILVWTHFRRDDSRN